jgi:hypothetical protein
LPCGGASDSPGLDSVKKLSRVDITVVKLDGKKIRRTLRTPPGRLLTPDGLEVVLKQEAERVTEFFPELEFRLVPLLDGRSFNFVEIPKAMSQADGFAEVLQ